MAIISGFGTAPEKKKQGYKGIGSIQGTDEAVLSQFFSDDVCLVRGAVLAHTVNEYEFFVMVK